VVVVAVSVADAVVTVAATVAATVVNHAGNQRRFISLKQRT
jgi:hypothetical protein